MLFRSVCPEELVVSVSSVESGSPVKEMVMEAFSMGISPTFAVTLICSLPIVSDPVVTAFSVRVFSALSPSLFTSMRIPRSLDSISLTPMICNEGCTCHPENDILSVW